MRSLPLGQSKPEQPRRFVWLYQGGYGSWWSQAFAGTGGGGGEQSPPLSVVPVASGRWGYPSLKNSCFGLLGRAVVAPQFDKDSSSGSPGQRRPVRLGRLFYGGPGGTLHGGNLGSAEGTLKAKIGTAGVVHTSLLGVKSYD